jgi:hypothetical protein
VVSYLIRRKSVYHTIVSITSIKDQHFYIMLETLSCLCIRRFIVLLLRQITQWRLYWVLCRNCKDYNILCNLITLWRYTYCILFTHSFPFLRYCRQSAHISRVEVTKHHQTYIQGYVLYEIVTRWKYWGGR